MALETSTYISGLVATNPTSSDNVGDGDNHIRLLKNTLKNTFPNITGAVSSTHTAINSAVVDANNATNSNTASRIVKRDGSGNFSAGTITANLVGGVTGNVVGNVTGNTSGNAGTATTLQTARNISLTGDVSGVASFNGSQNIAISTTIADDSHNHIIANVDGLQSALNGKLASSANAVSASKWQNARTITLSGDASGSVSIDGSANKTLTVTVNDDSHNHTIANVDGLQSALNGKLASSANAVSASKWQTARTITLGGDASGSVSIDGSANRTLSVTVNDDSHNHTIANVDGLQSALNGKATLLQVYPVGAIYISTVSTNPASLFGGTWVAFGAGRVLVGLDPNDSDFNQSQETGGAKTHTLSVGEMPSHSHSLTAMAQTSDTVNRTGGGQLSVSSTITTSSTGGNQAHNNLQPYIVVYMFKRTA